MINHFFKTRANAFQTYMDYKDIYNGFEAGEQNVNVHIGQARARCALRPVKNLDFYILQKSGYHLKALLYSYKLNKLPSEPHSKRAIPF